MRIRISGNILKKANIIVLVCLVIIGGIRFFTFSVSDTTDSNQPTKLKPIGEQPYIPEKLIFADENVPLQYNDVKESLDRELLVNAYWHSQTIMVMKRAARFFPVIEPILKQYGLPDDFKYVAVIESGLINTASSAGAKGFWQFLENTGKEYGLEINTDVDERLDVEKSTVAACKFFLKAYDKFKNWPMTMAAYNMGTSGLASMASNQESNNFYDLWLNTETARYVFRVIAAKLVFENPELYGFHISENQKYQPIETCDVTVDTSLVNLNEFAKNQCVSYKALKIFNPWLISRTLPNKSRKKYVLKIPKVGYREITFGKNN